MKQRLRKRDPEALLRQVAARNGVSAEEVRAQIQQAIRLGLMDQAPTARAFWGGFPRRDRAPTPEEVVAALLHQL